jgi:phage gpG-like protein
VPAGDTVSVDVRELRAVLDELAKNAENLPELMPAVAETLVGAVHEQFDTEGQGKWPPLAASTLAGRRGGGVGAKILQDTGLFAGSVTPFYGPDFAEAFTNVPYAIFHTSDAPRTKIPYRNPFDIDEEAVLEEVVGMIQRALVP